MENYPGEKELKDVYEKGDEIMSKRKIAERQARGEPVEVSEIFDEADEIGKMLEEHMGTERFNAAMKKVNGEDEE